jgi:signal transduction histidine kinase
MRSILLVALAVAGRQIGVLALDHGCQDHHFTPDEQAFAKAVGKLGALVLERERLLRDRAAALAQEASLREANRRMDEFLALASHELQNPLTALIGTIQLLDRRFSKLMPLADTERPIPVDQLNDSLRLVRQAATLVDRLRRLISDLLDVSRTQADQLDCQLAPCDLAQVARLDVEAQARADSTRQITYTTPLADAWVWGDADRLSQVITNFMTNARKYATPGTPIAARLIPEGAAFRFEVLDAGPGIPPDAQTRIWERFARAERTSAAGPAPGGLGLGLYICHTIIAAHHGQIGVTSAPGSGSLFWFALPHGPPSSENEVR